MPYTSMNGHMFSFLLPDGTLALRLPPDDRERFRANFQAGPVEQHGRVLKEYVAVPDRLFASTDELAPWFAASHGYVASLPPKATVKRSR